MIGSWRRISSFAPFIGGARRGRPEKGRAPVLGNCAAASPVTRAVSSRLADNCKSRLITKSLDFDAFERGGLKMYNSGARGNAEITLPTLAVVNIWHRLSRIELD